MDSCSVPHGLYSVLTVSLVVGKVLEQFPPLAWVRVAKGPQ